MRPSRPGAGPLARAAAAALVGVLAVLGPAGLAAASPRTAPASSADALTISVDDITPSTPRASSTPTPLTIRVTLVNTTATAYGKVSIRAERQSPIGTQSGLDESLKAADGSPGLAIAPTSATKSRTVDVPADGRQSTSFVTTTSTVDDDTGICLCHDAVYPIRLTAHVTRDGLDTVIGATTTYVPSIFSGVSPVQVAWVWPLLDRPHRFDSRTVFTDDDLADSIDGGRLDRALQVLEAVPASDPVTLVLDPDMLDELEVMATGDYTVRPLGSTSTATAGTGQDAAQQWLGRLRALVTARPRLTISLTAPADPDVDALTRAELAWDSSISTQLAASVTSALGGREASDSLAWPASGTVGPGTLGALVGKGASTVVLSTTAVRPSADDSGIPASVARLESGSAVVTAALTSPAIEARVAAAMNSADGAAQLPELVAEVAVRAVQTGPASPRLAITAPRYVDPPDPALAARVIAETSNSPFARPAALSSFAAARPDVASRLRGTADTAVGLSSSALQSARTVADTLPVAQSLLVPSATATSVLQSLAAASARSVSSAWRTSGTPFDKSAGFALARATTLRAESLTSGVSLVKPSSGSYTLGSDNSALPITVENSLPYPVRVSVSAATQNGLPGFSGRSVQVQRIDPRSKTIVRIPTVVERSGRIPVEVTLRTPEGARLGSSVSLYVHSTVFGVIGLVITVAAGSVLVLALVVRFYRRTVRQRRKKAAAAARRSNLQGTSV